ncbi:hypothetical protein LTR37_014651 [Vermiconidia calcicola]|uniref:Uncharacterized protein n=1 Tax=Vermiconidia calcicola TaxID=1690605 RepID=A0ACC3MT36_9PEZI|nr:hypothetical protein LTR37_014651 [Vermiconidia calcicola]
MADSGDVQTEKIASSGDVVLLVGKQIKVKLIVSTTVLTDTSKVFAALLGPMFREGQGLASSPQPKEIALPDDDPAAMSDLCHLLHNKPIFGMIQKDAMAASARILAFAVVCDKYTCAEALLLQAKAILHEWQMDCEGPTMTSTFRITVASYLLGHKAVFKSPTEALALKATRSLRVFHKSINNCRLTFTITIQEKMAQAQDKITVGLPRLGMPTCEHHPGRGWGSHSVNYDQAYLDALCTAFRVPCWPPQFGVEDRQFTIFKAIRVIEKVEGIDLSSGTCICTFAIDEVLAVDIKDLAQELNDICDGLCLWCVREGKTDLASKCTDTEHSQRP